MSAGDAGMIADRLTTVLPIILVGMLVALTFWLDRMAQPTGPAGGPSRHDPDYIVEGLAATRMGDTGTAAYTLSASRMTHYPDDDTTVLAAPRLVSYTSARSPVTITAREAVVSANGEHVYFQDDVLVTRAAYGDASELMMRTAFLHVIPEEKLARTDREVTITNAATTVTAVGLELSSDMRVVKLLSKVKGTYDPLKAEGRARR